MVWIIHRSDWYYPSVDVYQTEQEARAAWEKLKKERTPDEPYCENDMWDADFLAEVKEENRNPTSKYLQ